MSTTTDKPLAFVAVRPDADRSEPPTGYQVFERPDGHHGVLIQDSEGHGHMASSRRSDAVAATWSHYDTFTAPAAQAAYDRVARWLAAGRPIPREASGGHATRTETNTAAYLRAGLPGWEGQAMGTDEKPVSLRVYYMGHPEHGLIHEISVARVDDPLEQDGCHWEFMIEWHPLDGHLPPSPRVCLFGDAWRAFVEIPEFFAWLARHQDQCPGLSDIAIVLTAAVDGRIAFSGYWPLGCGVVGETAPRPVVHEDPTRVCSWWRGIGREAALAAWERGDLSEGQAAAMLGLDRVSARQALINWRAVNEPGVWRCSNGHEISRKAKPDMSGPCLTCAEPTAWHPKRAKCSECGDGSGFVSVGDIGGSRHIEACGTCPGPKGGQ